MKIIITILFTLTCFLSISQQEKSLDYYTTNKVEKDYSFIQRPNSTAKEISRIGFINGMNVKQLFEHLELKNVLDPKFLSEASFVTFVSYRDYENGSISFKIREWLSIDDVKFLMSVLDSEERCKCLVSGYSSFHPHKTTGTIGGIAGFFLELYRSNQTFPATLVIAPQNSKVLEKELKSWWKEFQNNKTTPNKM